MVLEIFVAICIIALMVYLFILYIEYSRGDFDTLLSDTTQKNTILYQLLTVYQYLPKAPSSLVDSYKYLNFWAQYYYAVSTNYLAVHGL